MPDLPIHLLLPLLASLLFVTGLIFTKKATTLGVSPWTVTFIANLWTGLLFSTLWLMGGTQQPLTLLWQPAILACLFILGQVLTFSALQFGDVSVAAPVFGIKVVIVAFLLTVFFGGSLPIAVWVGAAMATTGVALVQRNPSQEEGERKSLMLTVLLSASAASSFALFDTLIQTWAPAWGAGRILPCVFWIVAALSLGLLPWFQRDALFDSTKRKTLIPGTFLIAVQANCLVTTMATFGDAARVNVVYAMRGMWGVVLAYAAARIWGGNEADLPRNVLMSRFLGAALLTASVILVVLFGKP